MRKGSHLKEGLGTRSSGLEHDGEDGEDDDLDGGTASVPVGSTDTILREIFHQIQIFSIKISTNNFEQAAVMYCVAR